MGRTDRRRSARWAGRLAWALGWLGACGLGLAGCAPPAPEAPARLFGWNAAPSPLTWRLRVLEAGSETIRPIEEGGHSNVDQTTERVIRDEATWKSFYVRHHSNGESKPVPSVDFQREMVVAVVLKRPTGGYNLSIDRAELSADRLTIHYTETRPSPQSVVIQVLTQPYVIIALPRYDGTVVFEHLVRTVEPPS